MFCKSLKKWKLSCYNPCVPLQGINAETGIESKCIYKNMDITVPGNIYADLHKAGLIPDPYFEMNSLLCEWVPARWWVYETKFDVSEEITGKLFLKFESLCYKAHVIFNGKEFGIHENMYVPMEIDITDDYKKGENYVKVIFEHQPDEYSQVGYTAKSTTQKSRFDYKWDFSTRMINVGMLKPVTVYETPCARIKSYYFHTESINELTVDVEIEADMPQNAEIAANLCFNGKEQASAICSCALKKGTSIYTIKAPLKNVKLWYPNGYGEQNLYDLKLQLLCGEKSQILQQRVGFKDQKVIANDGAASNALPYLFCINGERVYLKGVNFVPLDVMLGTETEERYRKILKQLKDMNINFIRIWGGGVIESKTFYDLCGEYGFMVWQDMIQSSSGIDNYPSHIPEFLDNLYKTAEYAAKTLRNYVSIGAFCGGNELMHPSYRPVDFTCPNIKGLKDIFDRECNTIPFYPGSPSGELWEMACSIENPEKCHDVHGSWTYLGTEKHYALYNRAQSLLHSEFGTEGLSCRESAEKFMSEKNLGYINADDNAVWRFKGEWWNCYYREYGLFGDNIKDYDDFAFCSQFIQYEGIRYILESDRFRAWKNSGSFIWQANEPWPNISCTNLIDYYGAEKLACVGVKRCYDLVVAAAKYDSLVYERNKQASFTVRVINERGLKGVTYSYKVYADEKEILSGSGQNNGNFSEDVENVAFEIPDCNSVHIHLEAYVNGKTYPNDVLWLVKGKNGLCNVEAVKRFTEKIKR